MKIFGLCVIKNERDIIEQTLRCASTWCDQILVMDNGSDNGSWELVQALSEELRVIVPFKRDPRPFTDSLRDDILLAYKARARSGDWWCILDADEFYIDDPKAFLRGVPPSDRAVWHQIYSYLFTDLDLERYREDREAFDATSPIERRIRYYAVGEYSELRFFRHSRTLTCVPTRGYYPVHPRRIRIKHYAYRSPAQIEMRLAVRKPAMLRGEFVHEKRSNWTPGGVGLPGPALAADLPQGWEERVVPHSDCHYDRLDGLYAEAPDWTPPRRPGLPARVKRRASRVRRRVLAAHALVLDRLGSAVRASRDPFKARRPPPPPAAP
ncbi:glycosyltransferase family 2 protein [Phenylobacterium sp.]|jgi:hypothetical protein|uniref:glycosyltransferase family 2 protein n=1 Tax=Phenylobacterium sp. TaxID=1871053 RepID=UPI0037847E30